MSALTPLHWVSAHLRKMRLFRLLREALTEIRCSPTEARRRLLKV